MRRAIMSAMAKTCGFDWKSRNFLPMMEFMRTVMKKNERQMALIGVIHTIIFELPVAEECDAKMRAEVEKELTFKPPNRTRSPVRAG